CQTGLHQLPGHRPGPTSLKPEILPQLLPQLGREASSSKHLHIRGLMTTQLSLSREEVKITFFSLIQVTSLFPSPRNVRFRLSLLHFSWSRADICLISGRSRRNPS